MFASSAHTCRSQGCFRAGRTQFYRFLSRHSGAAKGRIGSRERRRTQHWADDHSGKLTDHPISEKGTFQDLARIMHWPLNNGFSRDPIDFPSHRALHTRNQSTQHDFFSIFFRVRNLNRRRKHISVKKTTANEKKNLHSP